jgi:hypothetical protein
MINKTDLILLVMSNATASEGNEFVATIGT